VFLKTELEEIGPIEGKRKRYPKRKANANKQIQKAKTQLGQDSLNEKRSKSKDSSKLPTNPKNFKPAQKTLKGGNKTVSVDKNHENKTFRNLPNSNPQQRTMAEQKNNESLWISNYGNSMNLSVHDNQVPAY